MHNTFANGYSFMSDAGGSKGPVASNLVRQEIHRETGQQLEDLLDEVEAHLTSMRTPAAPTHQATSIDQLVRESCRSLSSSIPRGDVTAAVRACQEIAGWAEARGRLRLAASYAAVAAKLDPADPNAAYVAGRFARRIADYPQAERWFHEAIARGNASSDWEAVSKAYSGLGNMHRQAGAPADAQAAHMRSLAIALKHDLRSLRGDGYHNLAVLAFESGAPDDAVSYARKALDAYGNNRTRIAALASDLGYVWLTHVRAPERALVIFTEVRRLVDDPAHQVQVLANIARAHGMLGDSAGFEQARAEVERLIKNTPEGAGYAAALLDLAHGAAALDRIRDARHTARRARILAEERQEQVVVEDARKFLQALPLHESLPAPVVRGVYAERRVDDLVLELMEALR